MTMSILFIPRLLGWGFQQECYRKIYTTTLFYITKFAGYKRYYVLSCSNVEGNVFPRPPDNRSLWYVVQKYSVQTLKCGQCFTFDLVQWFSTFLTRGPSLYKNIRWTNLL